MIEERKRNFIKKQRKLEIGRSTDIVEQLQILLKENGIRIGDGEGYHYYIQTLIELFTAPQDYSDQVRDEVAKYLMSLHMLVDELYEAFQRMTYGEEDLTHSYLLHPRLSRFKEL
ncbi:hypothetical protein G8C92_06565 [Paenibacillus donghaensis]|uniref:hypothetical protein n=1 Tax=Paenibacillus donghaensis TaxID=414771 RepID=UPI0018837D56|nr:hypothetical protein [Paenibacillus donghaensis]MBE9913693.1 hypothetical protein [Paenibacillus donghaensis]